MSFQKGWAAVGNKTTHTNFPVRQYRAFIFFQGLSSSPKKEYGCTILIPNCLVAISSRIFLIKEGRKYSTVPYLSLNEEILAVGADKGLGEEGREVDHDLSEQRADGSQRHLQLLGQLRLPATAV